jgi:hypothetical protein
MSSTSPPQLLHTQKSPNSGLYRAFVEEIAIFIRKKYSDKNTGHREKFGKRRLHVFRLQGWQEIAPAASISDRPGAEGNRKKPIPDRRCNYMINFQFFILHFSFSQPLPPFFPKTIA